MNTKDILNIKQNVYNYFDNFYKSINLTDRTQTVMKSNFNLHYEIMLEIVYRESIYKLQKNQECRLLFIAFSFHQFI